MAGLLDTPLMTLDRLWPEGQPTENALYNMSIAKQQAARDEANFGGQWPNLPEPTVWDQAGDAARWLGNRLTQPLDTTADEKMFNAIGDFFSPMGTGQFWDNVTESVMNPRETAVRAYEALDAPTEGPVAETLAGLPTTGNKAVDDLVKNEVPAGADTSKIVEAKTPQEGVAAASEVMADTAKKQMIAQGATEEQLTGWDKFTSEYDLATIGIALLASNDGSTNMSANLGKALMAGRQTVLNREARDSASAYAASKERRENQKVLIDQFNAWTDRYKAIAEGKGMKRKGTATQYENMIGGMLEQGGVSLDDFDNEAQKAAFISDMAEMVATEAENNPSIAPMTHAQRVLNQFHSQFKDTSIFGGTFGNTWEYQR